MAEHICVEVAAQELRHGILTSRQCQAATGPKDTGCGSTSLDWLTWMSRWTSGSEPDCPAGWPAKALLSSWKACTRAQAGIRQRKLTSKVVAWLPFLFLLVTAANSDFGRHDLMAGLFAQLQAPDEMLTVYHDR